MRQSDRGLSGLALTLAVLSGVGCETVADSPTTPSVPSPTAAPSPVGEEHPSVAGVTQAHNDVRADHGVARLAYDRELAAVAEAWLEQLDGEGCAMRHDYTSPLGENLFWTSVTADAQQVVDAWVSEVADYDYATNTCAPGRMCGHYTQVVWATTERLGCAARDCAGGRGQLWMCTYDPPGNWAGEWPY